MHMYVEEFKLKRVKLETGETSRFFDNYKLDLLEDERLKV